MDLTSLIGKSLIVLGVVIILVGVGLVVGGKRWFSNGIPGSISYSSGSFSFTFPILACIVLSVVLTIVLALVNRQ